MLFENIETFDFAVLDFIREHLTCPFLDAVLSVITRLGDAGLIWIVINLVLLFMPKYRRIGIVMAIGLIMSLLVGNVFLKNLIARPRPFIVNPLIELTIPPPSGYSFPSGHTLSSVISAVILSMYSRKAAAAAIPLAVVMAFSRLYFYVHFPTDILGGTILGLIIGFTVFMLCRNRILLYNKQEAK